MYKEKTLRTPSKKDGDDVESLRTTKVKYENERKERKAQYYSMKSYGSDLKSRYPRPPCEVIQNAQNTVERMVTWRKI